MPRRCELFARTAVRAGQARRLPYVGLHRSGLGRRAKVRANRLLVATHDAHRGRRMLTLPQCINGGNALPGRRGGKAFAKNHLRRRSRAGPIAPGVQFGSVGISQSLSSIAKQVLRFSDRQFRAHPSRHLSAVLLPHEQIGFGDGMKSYDGMGGILSG